MILPIIAGIIAAASIASGIAAVQKSHREAKAQTDPFLQEKKEVIKKLLQMSPYLPDMSYSDFSRMLGIEEGKRGFTPFIIPTLTGDPLSGLMSWQLFGNRTFPIFPTTDPLASAIAMSIAGREQKGGKK
jgi:hypothetical protein